MVQIISIITAFVLVILNVFVGHYASVGVESIALLMPVITGIIGLSTKFKPLIKVFIIYLLFAFNDFGIKIYGGGTHDAVGVAWIQLYSFIGFVFAFLVLILVLIFLMKNDEDSSLKEKMIALIAFIILIPAHIIGFSGFGL